MLVLDVNSDGVIDDESEIFGNQTGFANGFEQLASYDINQDGVIDASDEVFQDLFVWQDINQDGVSDEGELRKLTDVGIASFDLNYSNVNEENLGHAVTQRSQVNFSDGTSTIAEDVIFEAELIDSEPLIPEGFEYHTEAFVLPLLWGYAQIANSAVSVSMNETLRLQANDLVANLASGDWAEFQEGFEAYLYEWAGVSDVETDSRGSYVDARQLTFFEKAYGISFQQRVPGSFSSDPYAAVGAEISALFDELSDRLAARFIAQSASAEALLAAIDPENDSGIAELAEGYVTHPFLAFSALNEDSTSDTRSLTRELSEVLYVLNNSIDDGVISAEIATEAYNLLQGDFSDSEDDFRQQTQQALVDAGLDLSSELSARLTYYELNFKGGTDSGDVISGDEDGNVFDGGLGDDQITGSSNADVYVYSLGDGNDTITDYDSYYLNNGDTDTFTFTDLNAEDVSLAQGDNNALVMTLSTGEVITVTNYFDSDGDYAIEEMSFADGTAWDGVITLLGSSSDDILTGGDIDETLIGGAGDDVLDGSDGDDDHYGGDGDDYLYANVGDDFFDGGAGVDTIDLSYYSSGLTIDLAQSQIVFSTGGTENVVNVENIVGGSGNNVLIGDTGDNELFGADGDDDHYGGDGNDYLYGSYGDDYFEGGLGTDTVDFSYTSADLTMDLTQSSIVFESGFTETILNIENIVAGSGDDTLVGDNGDNVISGGYGNDVLSGGSGADTFVFGDDFGSDEISDFAATSDFIDFTQLGISMSQVSITGTEDGSEVTIVGRGTIQIIGIDAAGLSEDVFIF